MSRRFTLDAQAERDIDAIAEYLAEQEGLDLAIRFYDAAWASFEAVAASPNIGRPRQSLDPDLTGVRSWRIDGFPSLLAFYMPTGEGIRVLRVMHGARDVDAELEQHPRT